MHYITSSDQWHTKNDVGQKLLRTCLQLKADRQLHSWFLWIFKVFQVCNVLLAQAMLTVNNKHGEQIGCNPFVQTNKTKVQLTVLTSVLVGSSLYHKHILRYHSRWRITIPCNIVFVRNSNLENEPNLQKYIAINENNQSKFSSEYFINDNE